MPLPTCECVTGMPINEQLGFIYCALTQILANGGGGGTVNLEDIEGISDFWKATLGGTPAADQVFGTDGAGVFTTFDISDGGISLINTATPAEDNSFIYLQIDNQVGLQPFGVSASQNPVTQVDVTNGIITAIS